MNLFNQISFSGGLNTRMDSSKLPAESYSLLLNGRTTTNGVKPVKTHLKQSVPYGKKQGLYSFGKYLLLFVDGMAWWRDASTASNWLKIPGWSAMDTTVDRIYAELIPVSYFLGSISYTGENAGEAIMTYPVTGLASPTAQQVFITDGTSNPCRILALNGNWREVNNDLLKWTPSNPEYVPSGVILPKKSGGKLYLVDTATKTKIYHSVSGRFLDFIINRKGDGTLGGSEQTTFKSVDFNAITAIDAQNDGGLIVSTLYATYSVTPNYDRTLFAEPYLQETALFPTGALNERCFADILGDTAFITQEGIQAFNVTSQTKRESNNYPLGSPIARILVQPQRIAAAVNLDTFALFAVDTLYGNVVLIYDTTTESFVGMDTGFGEVIDFALVKYEGTRKLFFSNTNGEVFEAYAGSEYATARIYFGEFSLLAGNKQHRITNVNLMFDDCLEDFDVQCSVYTDGQLVARETRNLTGSNYPEISPAPTPRINYKTNQPVTFSFEGTPWGLKSGFYIEWNSGGELLSITADGGTLELESFSVPVRVTNQEFELIAISDIDYGPELASGTGLETLNSLVPDVYYTAVGDVVLGNRKFTNHAFQAKSPFCQIDGSLRSCTELSKIDPVLRGANYICGLGNYSVDGTAIGVNRFFNLVDRRRLIWVPGNQELDENSGRHHFDGVPTPAYYKAVVGNVDIFCLNSGYNTAGATVFPNTDVSDQASWLNRGLKESTARFKIILLHHPPYSDVTGITPGYPDLIWPYADWGADLVISGHAKVYQRFDKAGLPFVVLGPVGGTVGTVVNSTAVATSTSSGYLKLSLDSFNILGEWKDLDGNVLDAFTIHG